MSNTTKKKIALVCAITLILILASWDFASTHYYMCRYVEADTNLTMGSSPIEKKECEVEAQYWLLRLKRKGEYARKRAKRLSKSSDKLKRVVALAVSAGMAASGLDDQHYRYILFSLRYDPEPLVRGLVAEALGDLPGRDSESALCELLKDPDSLVRHDAATGAWKLRSERIARDVLDVVAMDPNLGVRLVAWGALMKTFGLPRDMFDPDAPEERRREQIERIRDKIEESLRAQPIEETKTVR